MALVDEYELEKFVKRAVKEDLLELIEFASKKERDPRKYQVIEELSVLKSWYELGFIKKTFFSILTKLFKKCEICGLDTFIPASTVFFDYFSDELKIVICPRCARTKKKKEEYLKAVFQDF